VGKSASSPTRMAADVVARAGAVAPVEHRTVSEQINYWARVGMQVERSVTVTTRQVLAAVNATGQFSALGADERRTAHALVDAAMAGNAATKMFGPAARAGGQRTVSLDDDGNLIEISPGGASRRL